MKRRALIVAVASGLLLGGCGGTAKVHSVGRALHSSGARWVRAIGASHGVVWVVDRHGFVLLSMDGGQTWRVSLRVYVRTRTVGEPFKRPNARVIADLTQMQFVDTRHGWISATVDGDPFTRPVDPRYSAIERTVDGGRHWLVSWLPVGWNAGSISFYDARHGYVAAFRSGTGDPGLFWTDDGGATWQFVTRLQRAENGSITFLNRLDGLLVTAPGTTSGSGPGPVQHWPAVLYRTADGGKTWATYRVPPPTLGGFSPFGPVSAFGRRLVVAEDGYPNHDTVYTSADAGAHWTASIPQLPAEAHMDAVISPTMWIFPTPGALDVTHDSGQTWERIVPRGLPGTDGYDSLVFSAPGVGWVETGRFGELYGTTDGGRDWKPVALRRS